VADDERKWGISAAWREAVRLSPETLDDLLRSLVASGQIQVVEAGGRLRYRVPLVHQTDGGSRNRTAATG